MDNEHLTRELAAIYAFVREARGAIDRHTHTRAWQSLDSAAAKLEGLSIHLGPPEPVEKTDAPS
jgi:hypothetical protein